MKTSPAPSAITPCIIGTAGHVDHGKTSLIRALTGIETDRLAEEKKRGLSIAIGFAHVDLPAKGGAPRRAAIVDVPGHERFIANMLSGITGIDMVLFVLAADDGVMPQTIEHLDIVRLLGVTRGVFAITKSDLASPERLDEVEAELKGLLNGTPLAGSPVVRVSSVTGEGMDELRGAIGEVLPVRDAGGGPFFRLPVDRTFPVKGFGTVVTGTVASGSAKRGDVLFRYPGGEEVKVRGLQSLHEETDRVVAGQRAALNLGGIQYREIKRGDVIAAPALRAYRPHPGGRLRVECFFELLQSNPPLREFSPVKNNARVKVHHLTGESLARLQLADGRKEARPGERVFGRLVLETPLLMLRGDRFIVRNPAAGATIGGGTVYLPRLSRELTPGPDHLRTPDSGTGSIAGEVLSWMLPDNGLGFEAATLPVALNMTQEAVMKERGGFTVLGGLLVDPKRLKGLKQMILDTLSSFHASSPAEQGMGEEAIEKCVLPAFGGGFPAPKRRTLVSAVLGAMEAEGAVVREGSLLRLKGHARALSGEDAEVERRIMALFSKDGISSVTAAGISSLPGDRKEVNRVLAYLLKEGRVVRLKEGVYLSGEAVREAREKLTVHILKTGGIRAAGFRDLIGCGRKLAIEILEYFDRERVTLRKGDERVLR